MMKNSKSLTGFVVAVVFIALTALFFANSISEGLVINGIDDNYSIRHLDSAALADGGLSVWDASIWLGRGYTYPLNTKYLFRAMFSMRWELVANLSFLILISSTFMYMLLRRFQVGRVAACFGAIAYSFAPHFMTLIYPCHIDSIACGAYVPMLFYFLALTFDSACAERINRWSTAALAGLAWGMVLNEDPQRGIYFSLAVGLYTLNLVFRYASFRPLKSKASVSTLGRGLLIFIIMLGVFAGNIARQIGSENLDGPATTAGADPAAQRWEFATSWSLNPRELADSIAPGYHGSITADPDRPYWGTRPVAHSSDALGFFVVLFAFFGATFGFRREARIRFFTIAAILATLLAFGRFWPGRPLFQLWYQLPLMDKFRAPVKFMAVTSFALAILSAYGLQYMLDSLRANSAAGRYLKRALIFLFVFGIIWMLGLIGNEPAMRTDTLLNRLGGNTELARQAFKNALVAVAVMNIYVLFSLVLISIAGRLRNYASMTMTVGCLFTMFLVFDLFFTDQFYFQKSLFKPDNLFAADEVIQFVQAQQDEPARVTTSLKFNHEGRMIPLALTGGRDYYITYLFPYFQLEFFDSPPQARVAGDYQAYFSAMLSGVPQVRSSAELLENMLAENIRLWQISNVKYLVTDGYLYGIRQQPLPVMEALQNAPELELLASVRSFQNRKQVIFAVRDAQPRFKFYGNYTTVARRSDALEVLAEPAFDPSVTAVVVGPMPGPQGSTAVGAIEPELLEYGRNRIRVRVAAAYAGLLVMNSRYDKNWKASIDGKSLETVPANYIMTGVPVPAGEHVIELVFDPDADALRLSLAMIAGALLMAGAGGLFSFAARRHAGRAG